MKWVDYREKLGIGFSDPQKFQALKYLIMTEFDQIELTKDMFSGLGFILYYQMVGEHPHARYDYFSAEGVENSILDGDDVFDVISKHIALINTSKKIFHDPVVGECYKMLLLSFLERLNIPYTMATDDDGIFIFPKGVPEFDDALVSAPLDWLKDYPRTEKAWSKALRAYSEVTPKNANDVADLFRKSLETFFQEFFNTGDGRTLEKSKSDYGKYLKDNGVPGEVSNNLETLLQAYTNYMNNYAKHTDKAKLNVQEYLMYQTGNIIRLVIMLKEGEAE